MVVLLAPVFHRKGSAVIDEKWTRAFTRNGRMIFATSILAQLKEEEREREKENPKVRKGGGGERQRASRRE